MSDTILLLGATGFVGGEILHRLLTSPPSLVGKVIVLTSGASKAKAVREWADSLKARSAQVSVQVEDVDRNAPGKWYDGVRQWSSKVDLAINAATSDDLELSRAINAGLIEAKKQGKKGTLVHLSGVQLIESEPVGTYVETPLYDDSDLKQIQGIDESAAHRTIDLEIGQVISNGSIWGSIVCPALIWGVAQGPIKRYSALVPDMVRKSLYNKHATYVGDGTNKWIHIHIAECVDLIALLVSDHLANPTGQGRDHALFGTFYFASHPDLVEFTEIGSGIGRVLKRRGLAESEEPRGVPAPKWDRSQKGVRIEDGERSKDDEETDKRTPIWPCRTNCRCVATRGTKELGWKAQRAFDAKAIEEDAEGALDLILKE